MKKKVIILIAVLCVLVLGVGIYFAVSKSSKETDQNDQNPSQQEEGQVVYHETFSEGQGNAVPAGEAVITAVNDKVFEGNEDGAAIYISNRVNNWDAVDFGFSGLNLENGKNYSITIIGYVDKEESIPEGSQVWLQTVDSYTWLSGADLIAGQAFTMKREFTVNTSADWGIRIQSNDAAASVPYYIGDILIVEKPIDTSKDENRPPAKKFETIDFEDQTASGFVGRAGTEVLTVTNEENHTKDGSYALKVENRSNNWHGPSLRVEQYVDKGYEYEVAVWVKLISPEVATLQLSTQVGETNASYHNLTSATVNASSGWVQLRGTYRYDSITDEYITIYVESPNSTDASFYIDDITFESTGKGEIAIDESLTPIKNVYQDEFLIGTVINYTDLSGIRMDLIKQHHNVVTAENSMKPVELQRAKGVFTFSGADTIVDKALAEGLKVHGHTLVWHQQSPEWMNTTKDAEGNLVPLSREEALENMETHIRTVMTHYGDKVISWDVVNEAMNDNPSNPSDWRGALRQSAWYQAIGDDYVEQAFLIARKVLDENPDWDIKLYYNDYNDDNQNKAEAIYSMVKELNEKYAATHDGKLLIDGIGMQGHYNSGTNPENVKLSLEKFISLGVEVSITELDIQAGSNYKLTEDEANYQAYLYARLFEIYKEYSDHIARVTFWGIDDATSWRRETNPLLFDKNFAPKPAYFAVIDPEEFLKNYVPPVKEAKQTTASYGTPSIDGVIDDIWSTTAEIPIDTYQMAWQGATGIAKAIWDEQNLYVLIQVNDSGLDKANENPWEQDSIEVFLDQNNAKTAYYQDDDGQYRVNYENVTTFNPDIIGEGFESVVKITDTGYLVEVKIPFTTIVPRADIVVGFDVQINDANGGVRQSVATWNDKTGMGYTDTSVYGELTLTK